MFRMPVSLFELNSFEAQLSFSDDKSNKEMIQTEIYLNSAGFSGVRGVSGGHFCVENTLWKQTEICVGMIKESCGREEKI